ncbi:MAG: family 16 glycoside hydrolase [Pirellulales bacterium]
MNVLRFVLTVCLLPSFSLASVAAGADGWQTLFDGKSLDAWRVYQQKADTPVKHWVIADGTLHRPEGGGDLITREQFGDFELEFDWKISEGGNSGVIYRATEDEPDSYRTGPEYQVLDNAATGHEATDDVAAGSLYALYSPTTDAAKPVGEWNTGRIVVDGNRIEHWLNGKKIVEADMASDDWRAKVANSKFANWKGFAKSKRGHIALQDHGNPVWYRNIRIRPMNEVQTAGAKPARLLFVTQSAGFKHGSVTRKASDLSPAEQVMTELGLSSGLFRVDCTQDVAKDFKRELLENYDIVMFYTTGDLPIDPETLDYFFNDWLKQKGHGFIGAHSAADTFHNYEPYWDMIGGTFVAHPWNADATVTIMVHDPSHPVAKPWGEEFTIQDEIYQFKNWQPEKVRVLMSLNMEKTDLKMPFHVPIAWVKNYGQGKAMHMSLGHREDVWTNPTYQESLLGGVKWILGQEEGDATPNPEVSAEEEKKAQATAK